MLEVGIKAPDFELPDQNGKTHRLSDYTGKKVDFIFLFQRIIHQDVRSRHVAFLSVIHSLLRRELLFSESVRILYPLIRDLRKNMDWHLHF